MKKPDLSAALKAGAEKPLPSRPPAPSSRAAAREKKVNISAWFDYPVKSTLDELQWMLKRELGRNVTLQEVLGMALNDLFRKHGLPETAPSKESGE